MLACDHIKQFRLMSVQGWGNTSVFLMRFFGITELFLSAWEKMLIFRSDTKK
jgi:predicted metallopeptidase